MTEDIPGYHWENSLSDANYAAFKMGLDGYGRGALLTTGRLGCEAENLNDLTPLYAGDEVFIRPRGTQGTDLPKTSIAPVLVDVVTRSAHNSLRNKRALSSGVVALLTSVKNDHVVVERILEANRKLVAVTKAQGNLADAMARVDAAVQLTSSDMPAPGSVSVDKLAEASDDQFIRLVAAASIMHQSARSPRAALYRYLGKPEGFDEAYEEFWTRSSLRRSIFDRDRSLEQIGKDIDVSVRFYADPFKAAQELKSLGAAYAIDVWELLRDELLALDLPKGWLTSGEEHILAAGALREVLDGNVNIATSAVDQLRPFWRTVILMHVKGGRGLTEYLTVLKQALPPAGA